MRSFGFQIWLERRSSRFSVSILEQKLNSAQASTLGEHFLASGPWIHQPMIHDVTKLKKRPRLGSLAARQTFFQAVDRLPRPGEVACIFSSLSSLNLLDQNWQRFGSLHKFTLSVHWTTPSKETLHAIVSNQQKHWILTLKYGLENPSP